MFSDIVSEAFEAMADLGGDCVTYQRGNYWVKLTAVSGRSTFTVDDGYGIVSKLRSRDFIVKASDLVLNGDKAEPTKGDLIKIENGNSLETYEVLRPDGSEQVYRYSDLGLTVYRIHTQLKGSVPL